MGTPSTITNADYELVFRGERDMTRARISVSAREANEKSEAEDDDALAEVVDPDDTNVSDLDKVARELEKS